MIRLFLIYAALFISASGFSQQLTDKEKALFVTPQYMGSYGFVFDNPSQYEKFSKEQFTGKSVEYDYTFRCNEKCKQTIVIQQSISIEATEKDADSTYLMEEETIRSMPGSKMAYKSYASYYPCGKHWDYKMLSVVGSDPVGFIYHYQKGNYTASLFIMGFVFDDPQLFKDFMEPLVKRADDAIEKL